VSRRQPCCELDEPVWALDSRQARHEHDDRSCRGQAESTASVFPVWKRAERNARRDDVVLVRTADTGGEQLVADAFADGDQSMGASREDTFSLHNGAGNRRREIAVKHVAKKCVDDDGLSGDAGRVTAEQSGLRGV
jgi:hypothetical protein